MKIQVDFYKPSGKWYAGGEVEIGDAKPYDDDLLYIIWENQQILTSKHSKYYTVVTNDTPDNDADPNYHYCFKSILQIGVYNGR